MTTVARVTTIVLAAVSVLWIVRSLRRERLTFTFAITWLLIVIGVVVFAIGGARVLDPVGLFFGFSYPPAFLLLVAIIVLLMITAHLSRQVAHLDRSMRELVQRYGEDHARPAAGDAGPAAGTDVAGDDAEGEPRREQQ